MKFYLSIFLLISKKRFYSLIILTCLTILTVILELLSISAVIPLLNSLFSETKYSEYNYLSEIVSYLPINNLFHINLIFYVFIFVSFFIFATTAKILLNLANGYLSYSLGHDFNKLIYSSILEKNYTYYLHNNSSKFFGAIQKSDQIRSAVYYMIQLLSSSILALFILIYLIILDSKLVFLSFSFIILFYIIFFRFLKKKITIISFDESKLINKRYKIIQESFSNFKEIIILNIKNFFYQKFVDTDKKLSLIYIFKNAISIVPGQISIVFALLSILSILLIFQDINGNLTVSIPVLGTLVLSLQRMLPYANNAYDSIVKLRSSKQSIIDVFSIIKKNNLNNNLNFSNNNKINFSKKLEIRNGFFRYDERKKNILDSINLKIKKNFIIGIYGKTGCGKSTLHYLN